MILTTVLWKGIPCCWWSQSMRASSPGWTRSQIPGLSWHLIYRHTPLCCLRSGTPSGDVFLPTIYRFSSTNRELTGIPPGVPWYFLFDQRQNHAYTLFHPGVDCIHWSVYPRRIHHGVPCIAPRTLPMTPVNPFDRKRIPLLQFADPSVWKCPRTGKEGSRFSREALPVIWSAYWRLLINIRMP